MAARVIKIDKNGTKYWADERCRKCGGEGYIRGYEYIEGGICFKCGGSGKEPTYTWKEYTPEYERVLAARREVRELT